MLEAGLVFAVQTEKGGDFIGRYAVLRKKEHGLSKRLLQFRATDPNVLLYHNEPILRDGKIVSFLTSGNYGHFLGGAIGLGYVPCADKGKRVANMLASNYQLEVAGRIVDVEASIKPFYDPNSARTRM